MSKLLTGKCMCGAVTITAEPATGGMADGGLGACHCGMCRAWTSSAFVEIAAKLGTVAVAGMGRTCILPRMRLASLVPRDR